MDVLRQRFLRPPENRLFPPAKPGVRLEEGNLTATRSLTKSPLFLSKRIYTDSQKFPVNPSYRPCTEKDNNQRQA